MFLRKVCALMLHIWKRFFVSVKYCGRLWPPTLSPFSHELHHSAATETIQRHSRAVSGKWRGCSLSSDLRALRVSFWTTDSGVGRIQRSFQCWGVFCKMPACLVMTPSSFYGRKRKVSIVTVTAEVNRTIGRKQRKGKDISIISKKYDKLENSDLFETCFLESKQ